MNPHRNTSSLVPLKNLVQYVEFYENSIAELLTLNTTVELTNKKCLDLLSLAYLIEYHHQKMYEQNVCEESVIQSMEIQEFSTAAFYKSVIIPKNYKILSWISHKILKSKNGVGLIDTLKVFHQSYGSKENFSNLIASLCNELWENDQNYNCLKLMLENASQAIGYQYEARLFASKLYFCPLEQSITSIIAFLKSTDIHIEHILHIINNEHNAFEHRTSILTLTVLCEMLLDFTLEGTLVWSKLFKIFENESKSSLDLLAVCLKNDFFYETICSFLKIYLKSLTAVRLSDYDFNFASNPASYEDFKLFSRIEFSDAVLLAQFLISEESPVKIDFSNQLLHSFDLQKELEDYLFKFFRNFEL